MKKIENYENLMRENALHIGLTEDEIDSAVSAYHKRPKLANYFLQNGIIKQKFGKQPYANLTKRYGGAFALAVSLLLITYTYNSYIEKGLPKNVFWDTMSDIKIWANNWKVKNAESGIGEVGWLKNHFCLDLFRIGRLQFQFSKLSNPKFSNLKDVRLNEQALFVHIPQGEALLIDDVKNSFKEANVFFEKYFPNFEYRFYLTETWLLYSENKNFMKEDCNILKFSDLFIHVADFNRTEEATERIFGKEFNTASKPTSLQKSCSAYLDAGGNVGVGLGYFNKNKISNF